MANIIFSQSSGLQDSVFGKSQAPIRAFIEARGEAFEQASIAKQIFNMLKSNQALEKFTGMTAMQGFMPVGENGEVPVTGFQEGFNKVFEHMTWKQSFSASREMVDDSKLLDFQSRPRAFVTAYYRGREEFAAALLGAAMQNLTAAAFMGKKFDVKTADGVTLFHAQHPSKTKGKAQSNYFNNPVLAEAIGLLQTRMQNFTDDEDNILDVAPDTIIIPNDAVLKKLVFEAIGSEKSPDTANNGFNYQYGMWNVIVWPYLNKYVTGANKPWILFDSRYNSDYNGAVWLDRVALEVNSMISETTHANVWTGYSRFTAGFHDWRPFCIGGITAAAAA